MTQHPTMMSMTVAEIAQAVSGRLVVPTQVEHVRNLQATNVVSDSRAVTQGSIFVAIIGERLDGHEFVKSVEQQGAICAIVSREIQNVSIAQIVVDNTIVALGDLARHNIALRRAARGDFHVIGITGSVGKTTTKDLLHALLAIQGNTVAPVGSFNNDIGLPLTALQVNESTQFLIAEMGANHVGEIENLTSIVPPDIAIVLKVGVAHLGEFGSVERIAQAKSEIVRGLVEGGIAVLNADDFRVSAMASLVGNRVLWFGIDAHKDRQYALSVSDIHADTFDRPAFTLTTASGESCLVQLGIQGMHNVMNALAAATVAHYYGIPLDRIAKELQAVSAISPHRMAVSKVRCGASSFVLIDDSFNANPDSMKAGLNGLHMWGEQKASQPFRVAVLGAMLELGADEQECHRNIGAYAIDCGVDAIIAVGSATDESLNSLAHAFIEGAEARSRQLGNSHTSLEWVQSTEQADGLVRQLAQSVDDTVVLLKGSHASGLSALAERWESEKVTK